MERNDSISLFSKAILTLLLAVPLLMPARCASTEIHVLSPPNYLSPALIREFEVNHGVTVLPTYYYNVDMREHSLNHAPNAARYDVVIIAAESARDYISANLTLPLNETLHLRNKQALPASTERHALFLSYSAMGLAYHKTRVEPLRHWAEFFELPQTFYGRVGVPQGHQDLMDAALLSINASTSEFDDDDITNAGRVVLRFLQRINPVLNTQNGRHPMLTGEVDYYIMSSTEADRLRAQDPNIEFIYPDNKTRIRQLYGIVSAHTPSPDAAFKLLDTLSSDRGAKMQGEYHDFAVANKHARTSLESIERQAIYPHSSVDMDYSKHANPRLEMRKAYLYERIKHAVSF